MNNFCIGLFGTCGGSKWREPFMEKYTELGVDFFNPQKENWSPEDALQEAEHLVSDNIILFPVTKETYGLGSLAETGFSIVQAIKSKSNVVVFIDMQLDAALEENQALCKESMRARRLVKAHLNKMNQSNVFLVESLDEMLELSLKLINDKNKTLTQEEKTEILYGIDSEGFEYYFCDYTNKWEKTPSEISELVKTFKETRDALNTAIKNWGIDLE